MGDQLRDAPASPVVVRCKDLRKTYEGKVYQQVHIIDASGDAWEALYTLEPQPDGTFKISGCVLKKAVTS